MEIDQISPALVGLIAAWALSLIFLYCFSEIIA